MRATLVDVAKHPSWLGVWWEEWPVKTRRFWSVLLFDKGQGWLRWGKDERIEHQYIDEGLEEPVPYVVAPPLRRLCWWLKQIPMIPWATLVGFYDDTTGKRYRFSWEEARPEDFKAALFTWYVDKDRPTELWGQTKKNLFTRRKRGFLR